MPRREPSADEPLTAHEVTRLFRQFGGRRVALAVSGGLDSTVLMHLVAQWLDMPDGRLWRDAWVTRTSVGGAGRDSRPVVVLTVDHALRAESAREAAAVADAAARLGLPHKTLVWHRPSEESQTPLAGLQEKARAARYRLMSDAVAAETDCPEQGKAGSALPRHTLVMAHHRDDQVETFLMRLSRGAGIDGLSAMRPLDVIVPTREAGDTSRLRVEVCRPLLDLPRSRLLATAKAMRLAWLEDSSNADLHFERVRWRHASKELEVLGLSAAALHSSIRRLQRARAVVQRHSRQQAGGTGVIPPYLTYHGGLFAEIDIFGHGTDCERVPRDLAHRELIARLLHDAIRDHGGGEVEPGLSQIEDMADDLLHQAAEHLAMAASPTSHPGNQISAATRLPARTLGGCRIDCRIDASQSAAVIRVWRESGRKPLPQHDLAPGESCIWDDRFAVKADERAPGTAKVAALGVEGWAKARRRVASLAGWRPIPPGAAATLPAIWLQGTVVAIPTLLTPPATKSPQLASRIAREVAGAYPVHDQAGKPLWTVRYLPRGAAFALDDPFSPIK